MEETTTAHPPLPLRARGVLELLDTTVKLYRQYFWVLIGWSAIVTVASVVGMGGMLLYPFLLPLVTGSVVCAVAAAVRGRSVTFNQCWQFIQPRFGGMLVVFLLVSLVVFFALIALGILSVLVIAAFVGAMNDLPAQLRVVAGLGGGLLFLLILSVAGAALFCWGSLAAVVAAMEEDKRNAQALGRAAELLNGQWLRAISLMMMLSLGLLMLVGICGGAAASLSGIVQGVGGLRDLFSGNTSSAAFWIAYLVFLAGQMALSTLWNPAQFLLITVFYLDVRVRKEALDIEWTAHQNAPARAVVETAPAETAPAETAPVETAPEAPASETPVTDDTLICSQCRTRNAANRTVCAACGTRLQALW